MKNKSRFLCLAISFFLITPWVFAAERILIQVHLFQGVWMEGQPGLKQAEVLAAASRPELSSLKDKVTGSESELTVAVINALSDLYGLQTVEDLFVHEKQWNGKVPLLDDVVLGKLVAYRIKLAPKMLSPQKFTLRATISKTNEGSLRTERTRETELNEAYKTTKNDKMMEVIVDQELVLEVGDPVIVGVPYGGRAYFMMVLATVGDSGAKKPEPEKARKPDLVAAPNAIIQVRPSYPEELRQRHIGGEIGLRIKIDEKGIVQGVNIVKPLHPYLNYSTVQAFRNWKFESVLRKGKPVPAEFLYTYNFNPLDYAQENAWGEETYGETDPLSLEKLRTVLGRSGDYCDKLAGAVLDFFCEERIKETHYSLLKNIHWAMLIVKNEPMGDGWIMVGKNVQIMDPKLTKRNDFLCDYQIVRKGGKIDERRFILKENGRKIAEQKKILEERRFSGLSSLFAPLRVLAGDRQPRFNYRIIDEEKIRSKKAHVIEAVPKSGNEDGIWSARIWVDKESYQILKCEIEGVPIDGYEDVLNDCAILNIKPIFLTTHEYGIEKSGVTFPSGSKVHVAYPGIDYRGPIEKLSINLAYDKYKFFTVETEPKIIK
ncbi:MAG: TonB family protein [Candidatus Aminicenantes bacterium]|nr:TonB family protein [Candidatus Aminicenantes bacterium]